MGSAGSAISTAGRSPAVGIKSCVKQKLPLGIIKPPKLQETALLFSTGRLVMSDHLERTSQNTRETGIHSFSVSTVRNLSQTVKEVVLTSEERPAPFTFKAGQWVDLFIPGVDTVGGFSVTSSPQELDMQSTLKLAVKYSTHPPALWIHNSCKVGDKLTLRIGGDFYLMPDQSISTQRKVLLIAGGVGINPIASIIQYIEHSTNAGLSHAESRVRLLYSAKTEDELIFKDTFDKFHAVNPLFFPSYFVTDSKHSPVDTDAKSDMIQQRRIRSSDISTAIDWIGNSNAEIKPEVYICGPPSMIKSFTSDLHALNTSVYYEQWW